MRHVQETSVINDAALKSVQLYKVLFNKYH